METPKSEQSQSEPNPKSELASSLGQAFASLLQVIDSKTPEEVNSNFKAGAEALCNLKGESPLTAGLVEFGKMLSELSSKLGNAKKRLDDILANPENVRIANEFVRDPQTFIDSIPPEVRHTRSFAEDLAYAYGCRDKIKAGDEKKILNLATPFEQLTLQLYTITHPIQQS